MNAAELSNRRLEEGWMDRITGRTPKEPEFYVAQAREVFKHIDKWVFNKASKVEGFGEAVWSVLRGEKGFAWFRNKLVILVSLEMDTWKENWDGRRNEGDA